MAESISALPYRIEPDGSISRTGDCSLLDLHAFAKGWVIDRAAECALAVEGVTQVVVNLGDDLVHRGSGELIARVEDPRQPFDNAPPMVLVRVVDAGMATSSPSRRPLRIGGTSYHHVLDPRTGRPADHILSASVVGPDAATADALATIAGVLPVRDGLAFADGEPGVACHLLDSDGVMWRNDRWVAAEVRD
jgi:thiamine biosynthesis lipoprotein